jgi:hypothetical protein
VLDLPEEGEKTYVVYNIADGVFIADYNSLEKDPVKGVFFNNAPPLCHAFREGGAGHDLVIGLASGDGEFWLYGFVADEFSPFGESFVDEFTPNRVLSLSSHGIYSCVAV